MTHWTKQQIKAFAHGLRERHGGGWPYMVDSIREAVVDAEALSIVQSQVTETVSVAAVRELAAALRKEMGLG